MPFALGLLVPVGAAQAVESSSGMAKRTSASSFLQRFGVRVCSSHSKGVSICVWLS